jgi:putative ABC transport system permease protein
MAHVEIECSDSIERLTISLIHSNNYMFKHLFKMIWNKKKQNFLLMFEMLISFLVLFAVFTMLVYNYRNYMKPLGFEHDNVWVVSYDNQYKTDNKDSLMRFYETVRQTIASMKQVRAISFASDNIPFFQNTSTTGITQNKRQVNGVNFIQVEDGYKDALGIKLAEGRWFNKTDVVYKHKPVVINRNLREQFFGSENATGKLLGDGKDEHKSIIIGVVDDIKMKGDYAVAGPSIFNRIDTSDFKWIDKIILKVSPDANAAFEGKLYKTLTSIMKKSNVEIEHLTNKQVSINYFALVPMIVLLIVSAFLMINVSLGLFGVLWYNINKRRGEIGLRRAMGATGKSVSGQLVSESLILATLSLVVGIFFAVQFPLLNVFDLPSVVYLIAILLSILFIYGLVFICSLYPGKQAASIYPAMALHED